MKNYDDLFEKLIAGKTVSLVGPAKYLETLGLGAEIDNCDVVVRVNRGHEIVETNSKNVGIRTDVLYSCLIEKPANAGTLSVKELQSKNIAMIIVPPSSSMLGISTSTTLHPMIDLRKVEEIDSKIPIRVIDHTFHTKLAQAVSCRPNTGFLSIYDILRFRPSCLKVFGFSFYLDGFMKGVKAGVESELKISETQFVDKCFMSTRHNQRNMWLFAKKTLLAKDDVVLDKVLRTILELKNLSRDEFHEKI